MCELLAYEGSDPFELNRMLAEFYSHSISHPDGWGLAVSDRGNTFIEKEPVTASKSTYLKDRLTSRIAPHAMLAHIRKATVGVQARENCHPFTGVDAFGRRWTLIHNGTLFKRNPTDAYISLQEGETDSERILLYLLAKLDGGAAEAGRPLGASERFAVVEGVVRELAPDNKLNLIAYDGEFLYAHCNMAGKLHWRRDESRVFFSTVPLSEGAWEAVPLTRLFAARDGGIAFCGQPHGHVYVPDPSTVKTMYMTFSGL